MPSQNDIRGLHFSLLPFIVGLALLGLGCSQFKSAHMYSGNLTAESVSVVAVKFGSYPAASSELITVDGACTSARPVEFQIQGLLAGTTECIEQKFSFSGSLPGIDGPKTVVATQRNVAGRMNQDSVSIAKDTEPPKIVIRNVIKNVRDIVVNGECENDLRVTLTGSVESPSDVLCTGGLFQVQTRVTTGDGAKMLRASQQDLAKNNGLAQQEIFLDTTPPTLTITSPAANSEFTDAIEIAGDCESGFDVLGSGLGLASAIGTACVNQRYRLNGNLSSGLGNKAVTIEQKDDSNNRAIRSLNLVRIAPQVPAPTVTISSPASGASFKEGLTLTGGCTNGIPVSISGAILAPITTVCTNAMFASGVTFSAGDGNKTITVAQTSGSATGSISRSFIRDSTPPQLTIATPTNNSEAQGSTRVSGLCETGIAVVLYGPGITGTASANCVSGAYSGQVVFTDGDGVKELRVGQTDAAQNFSTASVNIVKDTVAPSIAILLPLEGTVADSGLTLQGRCETGLDVVASGTGVSSMAQAPCDNQAFSLTIVFSTGDGGKSIMVSQTDRAGNKGTSSRSFVKAPPLSLDGPALYAQHCQSCHNPLLTSTKVGRTAAQILSARTAIPAMAAIPGMQALTSAQIEAIAKALTASGPVGVAPLRFTCTQPERRGLSRQSIRRLTTVELNNVLADLLGATIASDQRIRDYVSTLPEDIIRASVKDVAQSPAAVQAQTMLNISVRAAELTAANATLRNQIFGSCSSVVPVTDACAQTFIQTFGLKVWRRPFLASETANHLAQFKAMGGVEGLNRVLMRFLMAPPMVFHIEMGLSPMVDRVRLTDYEVASRLSFALVGSAPDAELLQAAAAGQLSSIANLKTHAKRLLVTARAKARLNDFFRYYTQEYRTLEPNATAGSANALTGAPFKNEMIQETADFLNHIVWTKNGTVADIYTSDEVFPRTDRMAKILETTRATGTAAVKTPVRHAGLLFRPAVLASADHSPNPYTRAARVRKGFLCEELGLPSDGAVLEREQQVGDLSQLSTRDRLTTLTNSPACLSCHGMLNPVGFSLEGYDSWGMTRTTENRFNENGQVVATFPVQTSVGRTYLIDDKGLEVQSLSDALGLRDTVAKGPASKSCFAQRVFEFQRVNTMSADDLCSLNEGEQAARSSSIQDVLINSIANEDIFWRAKGN